MEPEEIAQLGVPSRGIGPGAHGSARHLALELAHLPPQLMAVFPREASEVIVPAGWQREHGAALLDHGGDLQAVGGGEGRQEAERGRHRADRVQVPLHRLGGAVLQEGVPDLFLAAGHRDHIQVVGDIHPAQDAELPPCLLVKREQPAETAILVADGQELKRALTR